MINVVAQRTGKSREEASATVDSWIQTIDQAKQKASETAEQVKQKAQQAAEATRQSAQKAGFAGALALVIGAIVAGIAGGMGAPGLKEISKDHQAVR